MINNDRLFNILLKNEQEALPTSGLLFQECYKKELPHLEISQGFNVGLRNKFTINVKLKIK